MKRLLRVVALIGRYAAIGIAGPIAWAVHVYADSQKGKQ